jgi:hypothetical protein
LQPQVYGSSSEEDDLKYGMGGLSQAALMTNIELYGSQVIPRVRELLAETRGAVRSGMVTL